MYSLIIVYITNGILTGGQNFSVIQVAVESQPKHLELLHRLGGRLLGDALGSLLLVALVQLRLGVQGAVQAEAVIGAVGSDAALGVGLGDELLAASVDQEANEVGAHVVAGEIGEDLGEVGLVEVNVDKHETVKVLVGLGDSQAAVGLVDAGVAVVVGGIGLGLDALGGVLLEALDGKALEGGEHPGAGLDGVGRGDELGGGVGVVGGRVGGDLALDAGVDGPSGDVDLLALRDVERLEEGVHVLPAVELANAANLGLRDRHEGVAGAITVDELLNVGGLDLAAVVDDGAGRVDEDLSEIEGGVVELGKAHGDEDLVVAGGAADAAHLLRVDAEGVLAVLLEHGEGLEVGDLPHPVGVTGDPCKSVSMSKEF